MDVICFNNTNLERISVQICLVLGYVDIRTRMHLYWVEGCTKISMALTKLNITYIF